MRVPLTSLENPRVGETSLSLNIAVLILRCKWRFLSAVGMWGLHPWKGFGSRGIDLRVIRQELTIQDT